MAVGVHPPVAGLLPSAASAAVAASATVPDPLPAVSFDAWVAAAGGVARLDSSAHAGLVVEGLATVAPASWAAVNELLAFVALASAPLAGGAGSYRATANAVWPEDTLPVLPGVAGGAAVAGGPAAAAAVAAGGTAAGVVGPGAPGMAPSAGADGAADALLPVPAVTPAAPASPSVSAAVVAGMGGAGGVAGGGAAAAAAAPGGGLSPAGTPTALTPASPVPSSPGGSASSACRRSRAAAEARRAVADAMGQSHARQLLGVAAALGRMLQGVAAAYGVAPVAGAGGGAAATPAPAASPGGSSGTLHVKGTETAAALVAVAAEGTPRAWEATPLRREQVERLGWLLLTSFSGRCLSDVVTGWDAGGGGVPLGEVVRQLAAALARPSMAASAAGPLAGLVLGPSASTGAGATAAASSGVPASGVVDGSRLITISGLEKRTLMRRHPPPQEGGPVVGGAPAPLPDVRVVDCTDAHVYILFPVRRLTMLSCSAVTLFAAAASSTAVLACSDVSVHAATGRVSLANSLDARLYLHSVVNGHFREWLIASNNIRQLQELVALTPEGQ
ncbi:hypothetical protein I4F81_002728 [Pyropia yezoensis]|uniref:Uncharacterized protein n=1 Tax=Pyropia yezoensis TaxID=2788 RepID=A0ACC3BR58_PYRYE|nr:hypothetical protein I4F81_002728 [Neopyropia yezoensis]